MCDTCFASDSVGAGDEVVRRLLVRLLLEQDRRRRSSPCARPPTCLSSPDEPLRRLADRERRVAALLVVVARRREHERLARVDRAPFAVQRARRRSRAAATAATTAASAAPPPPLTRATIDRRIFAAAREPHRVRSVDVHLPEIEPIVDDRGLLARRESGRRRTRGAPAPGDRLPC